MTKEQKLGRVVKIGSHLWPFIDQPSMVMECPECGNQMTDTLEELSILWEDVEGKPNPLYRYKSLENGCSGEPCDYHCIKCGCGFNILVRDLFKVLSESEIFRLDRSTPGQ